MNRVVVYYNPFLPHLKISVNGRRLSPYSSLMSYQHQRLQKWSEVLFTELYREVNSDYELLCVSNEFTCDWLEELAERNPHCVSFTRRNLPLDGTVYERLGKLELLGCDPSSDSIVIPVINASGDRTMTSAVYEILCEQGIFEEASEEGITWTDCPMTTVELRTCDTVRDLPGEFPFAVILCSSAEDSVRLDTGAPVYALVMDASTRFIKRQGGKLYFSVEPDDIGKILLGILEEEALCPLLSHLSYHFPPEAKDFLTEAELAELELICQASPVCRVSLPRVCDVGRPVGLEAQVYPSDSGVNVRVLSDAPHVMEADGTTLYPRAPGTAELAVFIGDDPYPAAAETVRVQQRTLISDIALFPSVGCMPVGGEMQLTVTISPEGAENRDEIRWNSSDTSVAFVDPVTGVITANGCGRCSVTAFTEEVRKTVSLEVLPEMEDIICPSGFLSLTVGEQKPWRYQVVPENAYGADTLRVVCSDGSIAEYRGGYVVGRSPGECRIYIKNQSGSISRELKVSVKKAGLFR